MALGRGERARLHYDDARRQQTERRARNPDNRQGAVLGGQAQCKMAGKGDLYYSPRQSWASLLAMYNSCVRLDFGVAIDLLLEWEDQVERRWLCSRRAFFFVVDTRCSHTLSKLSKPSESNYIMAR
jgi:hypothetical protein